MLAMRGLWPVVCKQVPDDLDRLIAERARKNPKFPAMVAARTNRRVLQRQLANRRVALGMKKTEAAVLMNTSQSSIARLESSEHDLRVSTLERYAAVLGWSIEIALLRVTLGSRTRDSTSVVGRGEVDRPVPGEVTPDEPAQRVAISLRPERGVGQISASRCHLRADRPPLR